MAPAPPRVGAVRRLAFAAQAANLLWCSPPSVLLGFHVGDVSALSLTSPDHSSSARSSHEPAPPTTEVDANTAGSQSNLELLTMYRQAGVPDEELGLLFEGLTAPTSSREVDAEQEQLQQVVSEELLASGVSEEELRPIVTKLNELRPQNKHQIWEALRQAEVPEHEQQAIIERLHGMKIFNNTAGPSRPAVVEEEPRRPPSVPRLPSLEELPRGGSSSGAPPTTSVAPAGEDDAHHEDALPGEDHDDLPSTGSSTRGATYRGSTTGHDNMIFPHDLGSKENPITIALVGVTGEGKSETANTLAQNFARFVLKADNPVSTFLSPRFPSTFAVDTQLRDEAPFKPSAGKKSETSECHSGEFEFEGRHYRLIDTPGFLDNRGLDVENKLIKMVLGEDEEDEDPRCGGGEHDVKKGRPAGVHAFFFIAKLDERFQNQNFVALKRFADIFPEAHRHSAVLFTHMGKKRAQGPDLDEELRDGRRDVPGLDSTLAFVDERVESLGALNPAAERAKDRARILRLPRGDLPSALSTARTRIPEDEDNVGSAGGSSTSSSSSSGASTARGSEEEQDIIKVDDSFFDGGLAPPSAPALQSGGRGGLALAGAETTGTGTKLFLGNMNKLASSLGGGLNLMERLQEVLSARTTAQQEPNSVLFQILRETQGQPYDHNLVRRARDWRTEMKEKIAKNLTDDNHQIIMENLLRDVRAGTQGFGKDYFSREELEAVGLLPPLPPPAAPTAQEEAGVVSSGGRDHHEDDQQQGAPRASWRAPAAAPAKKEKIPEPSVKDRGPLFQRLLKNRFEKYLQEEKELAEKAEAERLQKAREEAELAEQRRIIAEQEARALELEREAAQKLKERREKVASDNRQDVEKFSKLLKEKMSRVAVNHHERRLRAAEAARLQQERARRAEEERRAQEERRAEEKRRQDRAQLLHDPREQQMFGDMLPLSYAY